jgi:hypothetical protein
MQSDTLGYRFSSQSACFIAVGNVKCCCGAGARSNTVTLHYLFLLISTDEVIIDNLPSLEGTVLLVPASYHPPWVRVGLKVCMVEIVCPHSREQDTW